MCSSCCFGFVAREFWYFVGGPQLEELTGERKYGSTELSAQMTKRPPATKRAQKVRTLWLDPSAIGMTALHTSRPNNRSPALRRVVFLAAAAGLVVGGIGSLLLLHPSDRKIANETA